MPDASRPSKPRLSALQLGGVLLAASALLGGVVGVLSSEAPGDDPLWLRGVLLVAAVGLLAGVLVYWRRMDEAAREAHKWAWYWGGSVGLLLAGAVVGLGGALDGLPWREWAQTPTDHGLVATGVVLCMTLQIAGYGVAWCWWWLSRR